MDVIKPIVLIVLSPQCYDEYFMNFNFLDVPCFKTTLSKLLGLGLILGSILVKVPQILKIYNSKRGVGISISSVTLDLTAITIYMSYSFVKHFPFTAWGDAAFLAIQTVIVGMLVLHYESSTVKAAIYLLAYLCCCFILMSGMTPVNILWNLQGVNIPILLTGKLMQAFTNYKNGNTGQLSAITLVMLFLGSLARIFTSIQETGDFMTIITYVASTFANTVLVVQLLYYWNKDITKKKD